MDRTPLNRAFTTKMFNIRKAPAKISLLGDKTIRPEPAQHVIEFPGGAIELSRTSDGYYWAHILINRQWADNNQEGMWNSLGEVVDSRITLEGDIIDLPDYPAVTQIAVLIKPCPKGGHTRSSTK